MTVHFRYEGTLTQVLTRFNVLTACFGIPRIKLDSSQGPGLEVLMNFYRQCTYFAVNPRRRWVTKMHINEIGIIVLFQLPGAVLKIHHHPEKQFSYLDLRIRPKQAELVWEAFSLNLFNDLRGARERGWLFRRLRRNPPDWYTPYRRDWLPSFYTPRRSCPLPLAVN